MATRYPTIDWSWAQKYRILSAETTADRVCLSTDIQASRPAVGAQQAGAEIVVSHLHFCLKAFPYTTERLMAGLAGMLDAICPVTRLSRMTGECNDNRGRPTAQGNEGRRIAVQKQSFGPAAAGFATHGSQRRIGFFKKAHGVGKSINERAPSPGTSCSYQAGDSSSSWAASLLTSTTKTNPYPIRARMRARMSSTSSSWAFPL
ncbi:MAG: hypothetical protein RLO21_11245, partial [Nitratireductor sp.]